MGVRDSPVFAEVWNHRVRDNNRNFVVHMSLGTTFYEQVFPEPLPWKPQNSETTLGLKQDPCLPEAHCEPHQLPLFKQLRCQEVKALNVHL